MAAAILVAYATGTFGTLLLWSIPIPVVMLAWAITMQWLYLDRVNALTLRMHRRSSAKAKEQPKAVRPAGNSEDVRHLDAAA
jgi:cytochrome c-type biogenesis protein CcmH/NrfF